MRRRRRPAPATAPRALLDRLVPGIPGDRHPRDLSEGQRLALVAGARARRRGPPWCCSTSRPAASTTPPSARWPPSCATSPPRGTRSLVSTHDVEFVAQSADDVVVLADGEVVSSGPVRRVVAESPVVRAPGDQGARPAVAARRRGRAGSSPGAVSVLVTAAVRGHARGRAIVLAVGLPRGPGRCCCWPLLLAASPDQHPRRPAVPLPRPAAGRGRGGARRAQRGRPRLPGARDARRAQRGQRDRCAASRPGIAGVELIFFLLILAGRVFGPGFGFVLGCTSLFASALLTAGVGPWLPFQMLCAAWVGMGAGLLPRRVTGRARDRDAGGVRRVRGVRLRPADEPLRLAVPRSASRCPGTRTRWPTSPGAAVLENLQRFLVYTLLTSTGGWDTGPRDHQRGRDRACSGRPC